MKNKLVIYFLSLIIAIGFISRIFGFGSNPTGLYWDEQAILLDARAIAETGQDIHTNSWLQPMFASYGDFKLPVYIWTTALIGKVIGFGPITVRVPALLVGLATIYLVADLAVLLYFQNKKEQKNRKLLILVSMAVVASSPWAIHFSRVGFEAFMGQFWLLISVWSLFKFKNRNWKYLSVIFGLLATYTYFSVRFVWLGLIVIWWLLENYKPFFSFKFKIGLKNLLPLVAMLLIYGLGLIPMFNSRYYSQSNQFRLSTESVLNAFDYPQISNKLRFSAGNNQVDRVIFHRHWLLVRQIAFNAGQQFDLGFIFLSGDPNLRHGTGQHGLYFLILLPFLFWGIYSLCTKNTKSAMLLLLWWLFAIIPAVVPMEVPHALRSLNALAPISILIAIGLYKFIKLNKIALTVIVAGIWFISLVEFSYFYFTVYPKISSEYWQTGFGQTAVSIHDLSRSSNKVWIDPFDNRFYLWFWEVLSSSELQSLDKPSFQSQEIGKFVFDGIRWSEIEDNDLIFGAKDYVLSEIEKNSLNYEIIKEYSINSEEFALLKAKK